MSGTPGSTGPQWLWASGQTQRFTPPNGPKTLYLAKDPFTALVEAEALFLDSEEQLVLSPIPPKVLFSVEGLALNVLDLADANIQSGIGATAQELGGPWRMTLPGQIAPTQMLGKLAYESGRATGLLATSRGYPSGQTIAIFTERLADYPPSYVQVVGVPGFRLP